MKKILVTVFQLSVTIGVLYWVYHDPDRRAQMLEAIRNAQYRWVAMGVLAYAVVELAAAFRWYVLLKVQKIRLTLPRLSGLFFIGMFYNQFLPGGTGGDIMKSYYLCWTRQIDRDLGRLSPLRASLARNARGVWGVAGSASCHFRHFSVCGLCIGRTGAAGEFLCRHAGRAHDLGVADQLCRNWAARKSIADHAQRPLRCAGSKSHSHRLTKFSHHPRLLSSRRPRLLVLQAEWRCRTRGIARDGRGSGDSGT